MEINSLDKLKELGIEEELSIEVEIDILHDVMYKLLDEGTIRGRAVKFKVQKQLNSKDKYKKLYAINKIVTNGKGAETTPDEDSIIDVLEATTKEVSELMAKRYIQNKGGNNYV